MNNLNSDLLIDVISFLNVKDSCFLSTTCKRMYFLVHQCQNILGTQLSTSYTSRPRGTRQPMDDYRQCLESLSSKPNFALVFLASDAEYDLCSYLHQNGPPELVTVGVKAPDIQANLHQNVECDIDACLMMVTMPPSNTNVIPFNLSGQTCRTLMKTLTNSTPKTEDMVEFWKVFILYVCGDGYYHAERIVSELQSRFPNATIVGGVCEYGNVSVQTGTKRNLEEVEDGVFGLALGGDVPVRTIVSRGMKSVTSGDKLSLEPSRWIVHDVEMTSPEDESYPLYADDDSALKPMYLVRSIMDKSSGQIVSPNVMFNSVTDQPEFIGLRRNQMDGYELHVIHSFSIQSDGIMLMSDGRSEENISPNNSEIDFFALDSEACLQDLDHTLKCLKLQTQNDVILGGMMFSCNGRGPEKSCMLRTEMADAGCFQKYFPRVCLGGFYAGGEIGPKAMVGKKDVFQKGEACVQAFTVVFALFVVPPVKPGSFTFEDSDSNIHEFVRQKLRERSTISRTRMAQGTK